MVHPFNNSRPALIHRPWITGKLYDDYTRPSILHCDAYVMKWNALKYLVIDWREGGKRQIALDAYLIQEDGLTPVWDAMSTLDAGVSLLWGTEGVPWAALHVRVLAQGPRMLALGKGKWARVATQAHYVKVRERDCELGAANKYVERVTLDTLETPTSDALATFGTIGKKLGRPRKIRNEMPDCL